MKRLAFIALALASTLAACSTKPTAPSGAGNVQTIAVTEAVLKYGASDTLRLGRLNSGEKALKTFMLRNDTKNPVVIVRHETSCNCTSFEYERKPILPDSLALIKCTFDTRGEFGWQFKLVKLRLSGADEPLRIFVEAEVAQ